MAEGIGEDVAGECLRTGFLRPARLAGAARPVEEVVVVDLLRVVAMRRRRFPGVAEPGEAFGIEAQTVAGSIIQL